MADYTSGFTSGLESVERTQGEQARIKEALGWLALQSQQEQRKQQALEQQKKAGAQAFAMMPGLSAPPTPPQAQQAPMTPPNAMAPGAPSQPMQPPGGPPMGAPGGMSMMPGAAPQPQQAPPPPWKPSMAAGPDLGGGGAPPIPGQPQTPAPNADILPPNLLTAQQAIELIQKNPNIPEEMRYPTLQAMLPIMDEQNRLAINKWHATTEAKKAATAAGKERFAEIMKESELHLKEYEAGTKDRLANARIKAMGQGGGGGSAAGMKNVEYIYPRKADGAIDDSQQPIGYRGIGKDGKMHVYDVDGGESSLAALGGGTPKEAKSSKVGVTNVVRQSIVKSGVTNSLARLDEIDKKFGDTTTTSSFFGQHADNPATRYLYGQGRSAQNPKQQQADAAWASFIDEAIPVFTGGLRGSDAFRRFLIDQAPAPGDKPDTVKEKKRLLRANINGTSRAFFNKFASDKSFWAEGTTPEDIEAVKTEGATPAEGKGEWKVEKVK